MIVVSLYAAVGIVSRRRSAFTLVATVFALLTHSTRLFQELGKQKKSAYFVVRFSKNILLRDSSA